MLRLATSSLTFDGFENNDYKCLFAHAAQTGYRRVEFNCWYGERLLPLHHGMGNEHIVG